jgi:epsin
LCLHLKQFLFLRRSLFLLGADYGGYSGSSSSGFRDTGAGNKGFDEYDAGDDEDGGVRRSGSVSRRAATTTTTTTASSSRSNTTAPAAKAAAPPAPKQPEVNLLDDFGDDAFGPPVAAAPAPATNKALPAVSLDDGAFYPFSLTFSWDTARSPLVENSPLADDGFGDFAAPVSAAPTPAPAPVAAAPKPPAGGMTLFDMLGSTPAAAAPKPPVQSPPPMGGMGMGAGVGGAGGMGGFGMMSPTAAAPNYTSPIQSQPLRPTGTSSPAIGTTAASAGKPAAAPAAKSSGGGGFEDLWTMSLGSGASAKPATPASSTAGKSMMDIQREKAQAAMWGSGGGAAAGGARPPPGPGAFGAFGASTTSSSAAPPSASDDLLG